MFCLWAYCLPRFEQSSNMPRFLLVSLHQWMDSLCTSMCHCSRGYSAYSSWSVSTMDHNGIFGKFLVSYSFVFGMVEIWWQCREVSCDVPRAALWATIKNDFHWAHCLWHRRRRKFMSSILTSKGGNDEFMTQDFWGINWLYCVASHWTRNYASRWWPESAWHFGARCRKNTLIFCW